MLINLTYSVLCTALYVFKKYWNMQFSVQATISKRIWQMMINFRELLPAIQMTHRNTAKYILGSSKYLETPRATCTIISGEHYLRSLFFEKRQAHTWRHSAALRKELRDSWDTCTSPRYMNSRRDAILWALVPSRITISPAGEGGIPSKSSWKCLLHAARINLCALNVTPETQIVYTILKI